MDLRVEIKLCKKYNLVELIDDSVNYKMSRSLLQQGERPNRNEYISRETYFETGDIHKLHF